MTALAGAAGQVIRALGGWGAAVVDGGTDSGVMRVIGHAHDTAGAFPGTRVVPLGDPAALCFAIGSVLAPPGQADAPGALPAPPAADPPAAGLPLLQVIELDLGRELAPLELFPAQRLLHPLGKLAHDIPSDASMSSTAWLSRAVRSSCA